ncbi:MAG: crossover junction endodeoxyribonuclease RuvC [Candidatus Magasanikbacteria bacterium CG10_big_fil_rev_8_21_14_0_10_47_10]|uniref:Crossover junction endodeoxyribonuclease RuvC n=1 Tax=Candidatus Magasanikbacteria bacterium CG10_big_fil_rev_8_21_14_0_10_47_10 TaxID=1974652 RepID=A0A2H0TQZ1_9BACT|nr:MAG: crossover junction endodeoxyribonuclease RuvC [Candidatus Magasanikbacteria bacterium CG10_big_fil_rev_8_21_14_0_10_47_10]
MVILGIDPGFGRIGWGIIEGSGNDWAYVAHGCIETSAAHELSRRLFDLSEALDSIIDMYHPDLAAIESLFFNKNVTTGIQVAHARGVILLSCFKRKIEIVERTPSQVKQAVVGHGAATKDQIQKMIGLHLHLKTPITQDDAADAIAIALSAR